MMDGSPSRGNSRVSLDEVIAGSDLGPERAIDDDPGPDARWERQPILDATHEVIQNRLTEKQREALLAELRGTPQDEIARHLGSIAYPSVPHATRSTRRSCERSGPWTC
jgi:hypothetical protein